MLLELLILKKREICFTTKAFLTFFDFLVCLKTNGVLLIKSIVSNDFWIKFLISRSVHSSYKYFILALNVLSASLDHIIS